MPLFPRAASRVEVRLFQLRLLVLLGALPLWACVSSEPGEPLVPEMSAPTDAGGCTGDQSCSGATPRCHLESGQCVGCLTSADCNTGYCDAATNRCALLPDSCASALPLDLFGNMSQVTGDTSYADNDTALPCALPGSSGRDVVYVVSLTARSSFEAVATPSPGSQLRPVLALRRVCNSADSTLSLGCAYKSASTASTRLAIDSVEPGTYFLWLDSEGGEAGAYSLTVKLDPAATGDSCGSARALLLAQTPVEVLGDTQLLADDVSGTCGGQSAPDAVFRLENSQVRRVSFEVSAMESGWTPVIYLRTGGCDDATKAGQAGCVTGVSGTAVLDFPRLEAGTSYLFVDGLSASPASPKSGKFRLRIVPREAIPPPTNDRCAAALEIAVPPQGVGQVLSQGDTSNASNDALSCGGAGNDLVYQFELAQARQVTVRAVPLAGSAFRPALYLRREGRCSSEMLADQMGCAVGPVGGAATLTLPNLAAGQWYLWVDGVGGSAGPFDLSVDFGPAVSPPANDTCSAMQKLGLSSGAITVTGTTLGAGDETTSCQYPAGLHSPDVVYELSVPTRQSVGIEVKALAGSSIRPVVTLRAPGQCADTQLSSELICAWNDSQFVDRVALTLPDVPAGDYPLWVDGDVGSQGAFSLRLTPGPVISRPLNDNCSTVGQVPSLVLGTAVTGDTRGAAGDDQGSCALAPGANGESAPDVVYKLVLATAKSVVVTVTPDVNEGQLFRPVVYVRGPGLGSCEEPQQLKACGAATTYGGQAAISVPNLSAGTYYVWVDGAGLSGGKFSLKVQ